MKYIHFRPFTKPIFATKYLSWVPIVELELFRHFSKINHKFEIMFSDNKSLTWLWFKDGKFEFRKVWK